MVCHVVCWCGLCGVSCGLLVWFMWCVMWFVGVVYVVCHVVCWCGLCGVSCGLLVWFMWCVMWFVGVVYVVCHVVCWCGLCGVSCGLLVWFMWCVMWFVGVVYVVCIICWCVDVVRGRKWLFERGLQRSVRRRKTIKLGMRILDMPEGRGMDAIKPPSQPDGKIGVAMVCLLTKLVLSTSLLTLLLILLLLLLLLLIVVVLLLLFFFLSSQA